MKSLRVNKNECGSVKGGLWGGGGTMVMVGQMKDIAITGLPSCAPEE